MSQPRVQFLGSLALGLSLAVFAVFLLNVVIGGPLGKKPWMSDLWEMLTLFVSVFLFVVGTICREAQSAGNHAGKTTGRES